MREAARREARLGRGEQGAAHTPAVGVGVDVDRVDLAATQRLSLTLRSR